MCQTPVAKDCELDGKKGKREEEDARSEEEEGSIQSLMPKQDALKK